MTLAKNLSIVAFSLAVCSSSAALAQTPQQEALAVNHEVEEDKHSINASPLGVLVGAYSLNYEYLLGGTHGFLVEASLSRSSDDTSSAANFGGNIGYRWHWRGRQNSGFLGINAGFATGTGEATVTSGGMSESFDLSTRLISLTANVGKRWAWDSGLNITLRIGGGYGDWKVTTDSQDPDAQEAVDDVQDILELLPIALDGELSVGYTF